MYDWHFVDGDTAPNYPKKFSNRILYANKPFLKKILKQNLIFCVHNVVLDAIMLSCFLIAVQFFLFKNAKKIFFFIWRAYVCIDQI